MFLVKFHEKTMENERNDNTDRKHQRKPEMRRKNSQSGDETPILANLNLFNHL